MEEHRDLPFKAEYAKSSRASCKACHSQISKESLRLAIMVQSGHFDGKIPNWFHFACFWKRAKVQNHIDIHGFDALRWEDQSKIKEKIGGAVSTGAETNYKEFSTEYAKSSRSKCRGCDEKILKDEVRVAKKEFEGQRAKMYGPQDLWHHVDCFVEKREELEFESTADISQIVGFKTLKSEDQAMLIEKIGKGDPSKKRKSEQSDKKAKKMKKETAEEKCLREQSQLIWQIRDQLSKLVSNNALKALLEYNNQDLPAGESRLLDQVSDCMAFGVLKPCKECGGQLAIVGDGYRCTGNVTEWTKCINFTQTPERNPFKVPEEFHDVDLLKNYKYVKRQRVFPAITAASTVGIAGKTPLKGMKFFILKNTEKPKADLALSITNLGGKVTSKINSKIAACIGTKEAVEKMDKHVEEAKAADIQIVNEAFVEAARAGGIIELITKHNICSWGSDPKKRLGDAVDVVDGPVKSAAKSAYLEKRDKRDEAMFTKSVPSTMKMKVKGGAAVDPDSGLENTAHVCQEKGEIYNAVLGMVDIVRGTNSYYKIQALESDSGSCWWVFRAWGRVGTTIGGNKVERCGSKKSAVSAFKDLYMEKTGNTWSERKNFNKFPNKFYPMDIDYEADNEKVVKLGASAGSKSKLSQPVQDLIRMIFDVESMKKTMLEFEIDLKKMPLGKLSKKQIESAYKVLNELQELVEKAGTPTQFLDGSNRFYTLIPHDFGMKKIPMLDSEEVIKSKIEMLDNLLEIEVAYSLLKGGDDGGKDPLDAHYDKLKTKISPMKKDSEDYQRLLTYVKNTHAATHNQYELEVEEIFEVERQGESKRYRPFRDLHNRQLLWHGSRTTNYAGILSQGLRIAPPEAPVTGYMFGKGIYFADMVSKSANYCRTSKSDPIGVLLLCEVALGNMYEVDHAEYITKLPKGKHSTKGCGMTEPDPKMTFKTPDGVEIPLGEGTPVQSSTRKSLLYNEYIVYDVAQISVKYLLKTKFDFQW